MTHLPFQSSNPPLRLLAAFQDACPGQPPEWIVRAPGREMWLAAIRVTLRQFTLIAPDLEARTTFDLRSARGRRTVDQRPLPRWAVYAAGVTLALVDQGLDITGLKLVAVGEEPPGPRYDYGLGMALAALWHDIYGLEYTIDRLIEVVDRARREYVEV
jgi:galactokinase